MKKFYVILMCLICLVPSAGMLIAKTDTTAEKRTLASFPALTTQEGRFNKSFFQDFDAYFNDHFALRSVLVSTDAMLMGRVFQTSNVDTVLVGKNGWLFYTATLDDYSAQNTMSERELFNTAHNLALLQEYVQNQGSDFLFTVAPNKNTLYDAQMPRCYVAAKEGTRNLDRLLPYLEQCGVNYAELRDLFSDKENPLYFARDSHWTNRGALLVYRRLCDALSLPHKGFEDAVPKEDTRYVGDLEQMLYPLWSRYETNEIYDDYFSFAYGDRFQSVEDAIIETTGGGENESLLMYRDSFGNALLPFFADAFQNGYFVKTQPYNTALHIKTKQPSVVIAEKVERNLSDYIEMPPIIPAPARDPGPCETRLTDSTIEAVPVEANAGFFAVRGTLDPSVELPPNSTVCVSLSDGNSAAAYEAFGVTDDTGENAFIAFFDRRAFSAASYEAAVILCGEENTVVSSAVLEIPSSEMDEILK